jgi:autotransporter-associated beta strand protein
MRLIKAFLLSASAGLLPATLSASLIWEGYVNNVWDLTTTNWLGAGGRESIVSSFGGGGVIQFDDTAFNPAATNVDLVIAGAAPVAVLVTNNVLDYALTGSGILTGSMQLTKAGSAGFTLAGTALYDFHGGVAVNGGTVVFATDNLISGGLTIADGATAQVGTNGGSGTLPLGAVTDNGSLIFDRGAVASVSSGISGSGTIEVASGTLQTASGSALNVAGGTTVDSGATLDVFGQNLGAEPVTVSGAGVGGEGAIISSNPGSQYNALRLVTLAGDTSFGGNGGRWDIRESAPGAADATLNMSPPGGGYTLTKVGSNYVALVGVGTDGTFDDVNIQAGTLGVEGGTVLPILGQLTVSPGATLELFNLLTPLGAAITLSGDGVTSTVLVQAGSPVFQGVVTLDSTGGSVIVSNDVVQGGSIQVTFEAEVTGNGSLVKTGGGQLTLNGVANYTGTTIVSNGVFLVDGVKMAGAGVTIESGATLGGDGYLGENITVNGGVSPGDPNGLNPASLQIGGDATLNGTTNVFELSNNPGGANDQMQVFGNLTLTGNNVFQITALQALPLGAVYTLVEYTGTGSNVDAGHITIVPPASGYSVALIDPATTTNMIQIQVTQHVPPRITSFSRSGNNLIINGTNNNGTTPGTYHILSSTNAGLALNKWLVLTNGSFDGSGRFSFTNPVSGAMQRFYTIEVP